VDRDAIHRQRVVEVAGPSQHVCDLAATRVRETLVAELGEAVDSLLETHPRLRQPPAPREQVSLAHRRKGDDVRVAAPVGGLSPGGQDLLDHGRVAGAEAHRDA